MPPGNHPYLTFILIYADGWANNSAACFYCPQILQGLLSFASRLSYRLR
jgi:hypothetical protein